MPPNPSPPIDDEEETEHKFGCDPEKFYEKYPDLLFKLKGSRHLGHDEESKRKQQQQQMIGQCATLLQEMEQLFEIIADDCEHTTGHGGCKLNIDGCTGASCPMGGK